MKPERQVLTKELRDKVHARIESCIEIAKREYPAHDWPMPEIRYDVKNTDGGLAYGEQWLIRLNLILCFENEEHFVHQIVGHEFAHLMQRRIYGNTKEVMENGVLKIKKVRAHGPEWKHCMNVLDLIPKTTHSYDVSSIQRKPRKRRTVLNFADTQDMLRRLQNGFKRLSPLAQQDFLAWCEERERS